MFLDKNIYGLQSCTRECSLLVREEKCLKPVFKAGEISRLLQVTREFLEKLLCLL